MPGQSIKTRLRNALEIDGALVAQVEVLVEHLRAVLAEDLRPGERMPDFALFVELLRRRLERRRRDLVKADDARLNERAARREPRRRRDRAVRRLTTLLRDLGRAVDATYGRGLRNEVLGLDGRLPRAPLVLARQARITIGRLDDLDRLPRRPGFTIDAEYWTASLETAVRELERAMHVVRNELQESYGTTGERKAVYRAFDADYLPIVRILDGCYRLAGLRELSRKWVPRVHVRRRRRPGETRSETERPAESSVDPAPEA